MRSEDNSHAIQTDIKMLGPQHYMGDTQVNETEKYIRRIGYVAYVKKQCQIEQKKAIKICKIIGEKSMMRVDELHQSAMIESYQDMHLEIQKTSAL